MNQGTHLPTGHQILSTLPLPHFGEGAAIVRKEWRIGLEYDTSMSDSVPGYPEFRRRLDDVLRQRDPAALRAFLIAEGQWTPETATDPEAAMWMMIATSPALSNLRDEARQWLMAHGYEAEAQAIFGAKRPAGNPPHHGGRPPGKGSARPPGKGQGRANKPGKSHDDRRPQG